MKKKGKAKKRRSREGVVVRAINRASNRQAIELGVQMDKLAILLATAVVMTCGHQLSVEAIDNAEEWVLELFERSPYRTAGAWSRLGGSVR